MGQDYLPHGDAEFLEWMTNFHSYAAANTVALSLDASDVTEIQNQKNLFAAAQAANVAAQDAAVGARANKDDVRASVEAYFRTMARRMTYNEITDAQRGGLGLPIRDTIATRVGVPTTKPVLQIEIAAAQQHTVCFADEGTPTDKKKPAGVRAAEIWFKKGGTAPATEADWTYLAADSATPYVLRFPVEEVGTSVWYRARWVNTRNEPGPWGPAVTARVPG